MSKTKPVKVPRIQIDGDEDFGDLAQSLDQVLFKLLKSLNFGVLAQYRPLLEPLAEKEDIDTFELKIASELSLTALSFATSHVALEVLAHHSMHPEEKCAPSIIEIYVEIFRELLAATVLDSVDANKHLEPIEGLERKGTEGEVFVETVACKTVLH